MKGKEMLAISEAMQGGKEVFLMLVLIGFGFACLGALNLYLRNH